VLVGRHSQNFGISVTYPYGRFRFKLAVEKMEVIKMDAAVLSVDSSNLSSSAVGVGREELNLDDTETAVELFGSLIYWAHLFCNIND
jgi:hypothetical protein